jgi:hypothetical protein
MSRPLASRLSSPKTTPLIDRIAPEQPPSPIAPAIDTPPKENTESPLVSLGTSTSPDAPVAAPPPAPGPPEPRRTSRISPTTTKKAPPPAGPSSKKTAPTNRLLLPIPPGPVSLTCWLRKHPFLTKSQVRPMLSSHQAELRLPTTPRTMQLLPRRWQGLLLERRIPDW